MLYDWIAAECAHVSIAGRSTASIIDGKKHFLEQRARPPLARFSNLARLERGRHARYGSFAAEHFAPLRSGVWYATTYGIPDKPQFPFDAKTEEVVLDLRALRLHDRVVQPTTKSYVVLPTSRGVDTWFQHPWVNRVRSLCLKNACYLIFTHPVATGDHNHVSRYSYFSVNPNVGSYSWD